MNYEDNNGFLTYWQAIALTGVFVLFAGLLVFCGQSITAATAPPKTVSAPITTPSPLYASLTEQARASAKVQVVTTEADNQLSGWYAIPVGLIAIGLGVGYWGLRYGRRGQDA